MKLKRKSEGEYVVLMIDPRATHNCNHRKFRVPVVKTKEFKCILRKSGGCKRYGKV